MSNGLIQPRRLNHGIPDDQDLHPVPGLQLVNRSLPEAQRRRLNEAMREREDPSSG